MTLKVDLNTISFAKEAKKSISDETKTKSTNDNLIFGDLSKESYSNYEINPEQYDQIFEKEEIKKVNSKSLDEIIEANDSFQKFAEEKRANIRLQNYANSYPQIFNEDGTYNSEELMNAYGNREALANQYPQILNEDGTYNYAEIQNLYNQGVAIDVDCGTIRDLYLTGQMSEQDVMDFYAQLNENGVSTLPYEMHFALTGEMIK